MTEQLTLLPEDTLASRSALPGSEKVRMMTATSGQLCLASSKSTGQLGLLERTLLATSACGLDDVLSDLAGQGYEARTFVIPACAVDARHRRDRTWIVANSNLPHSKGGGISGRVFPEHSDINGRGSHENVVADSASIRQSGQGKSIQWRDKTQEREGEANKPFTMREPRFWPAEPAVGRVANGVPNRVDRLKSLGNAVVPQIPEMIGYAILEAEKLNLK